MKTYNWSLCWAFIGTGIFWVVVLLVVIFLQGCRTQIVEVESESGRTRQECTQIMPFPLAPVGFNSDPWLTVHCAEPMKVSP